MIPHGHKTSQLVQDAKAMGIQCCPGDALRNASTNGKALTPPTRNPRLRQPQHHKLAGASENWSRNGLVLGDEDVFHRQRQATEVVGIHLMCVA